VAKRSDSKDYCPGYYEIASGGVVASDDSNIKEAALREL
jgi:hypothetical protein